MTVHLLGGVGQVGLHQGVVEEPREASQHEPEVFLPVNAGQVVDEQVLACLEKSQLFHQPHGDSPVTSLVKSTSEFAQDSSGYHSPLSTHASVSNLAFTRHASFNER